MNPVTYDSIAPNIAPESVRSSFAWDEAQRRFVAR